MLNNNMVFAAKVICIERGMTQAQLTDVVGKSNLYVNRFIKKHNGILDKIFVLMIDALGYDVELINVKKEQNMKGDYYGK